MANILHPTQTQAAARGFRSYSVVYIGMLATAKKGIQMILYGEKKFDSVS